MLLSSNGNQLYLLDKFLAQSVDFIKITFAVKGVIGKMKDVLHNS